MIGRVCTVLGTVLMLSGCVSILEGTAQQITVNTTPSEATCDFQREGASIGTIVKTPGSLVVRKNKYDITIRCNKPGYQEASYLNHSGVSAAIAANVVVDVLFTAGIASIVDSANGADNKYESVVNLVLVPATGDESSGSASGPPAV